MTRPHARNLQMLELTQALDEQRARIADLEQQQQDSTARYESLLLAMHQQICTMRSMMEQHHTRSNEVLARVELVIEDSNDYKQTILSSFNNLRASIVETRDAQIATQSMLRRRTPAELYLLTERERAA